MIPTCRVGVYDGDVVIKVGDEGLRVGEHVGDDGSYEGTSLDAYVGIIVGDVGVNDGLVEGLEGVTVGLTVGLEGATVGLSDGVFVGLTVGFEGAIEIVGSNVGENVLGSNVGENVA